MSLLFSPAKLGSLTVKNRLIMSPMQRYQGTASAMATEYHVQHYSRSARGGVGLVMLESTAVSADGRLFDDDIGIFTDEHIGPMRAIVDAIHHESAVAMIQLCHGGRKSVPQGNNPPWAPSQIPFSQAYGMPRAMTVEQIGAVIDSFAAAARRARIAGFDGVEIHAAHGYLIHQFLSPLSNTRLDKYGGTPENRGRFLREVLAAIRAAVVEQFPVVVRVSATDFVAGGLTPVDVAAALQPLIELGLDGVDVSAGSLLPVAPDNRGPEFQVPYAKTIRGILGIPVIAVGQIRKGARAEEILRRGDADFIAIGRPFLENPDYAQDLRDDIRYAEAASHSVCASA